MSRKIKSFFISVLMCVGGAATANDYFVSVEVGNASTNAPTVNVPEDIAENVITSADDSDVGWALQFGYRFNQNWSAAIGYVDLGEGKMVFEGDTDDPASFLQFASNAPILAKGGTASVVYHLFRKDNLFVDVEFGVFKWDSDIESATSSARLRREESGTDLVAGVTIGVEVATQWSVVAGYKHYNLDEPIKFPYLGVKYHF